MDLTLVIPVFNEVESIGPLLDEISARFEAETGYEIIVVDDGSSDGTPAVLQAARQSHPQLRILRHRECYGQSAAIASGVQAAGKSWIATLDGDGQNDPADILKLFRVMDETPDDVYLVTGYLTSPAACRSRASVWPYTIRRTGSGPAPVCRSDRSHVGITSPAAGRTVR